MVTLALSVILAAKTVAVVDLSSPKAPAVAEALRKVPALKGAAMNGQKTNAAVADAAGLGLTCTVDDGPCLEKLLVLLRADELVAFSAPAGSNVLAIVHVSGNHTARRAQVKTAFSPAATAQAAWSALESTNPDAPPDPPKDGVKDPLVPTTKDPAPAKEKDDGGPTFKDGTPLGKGQPPATPEGVSPALAVAIGGGAVGVACAAAALGVSADLARQQTNADEHRVPVGDNYYAGQAVFFTLAGCSAVASAAGIVGTVLVVGSD